MNGYTVPSSAIKYGVLENPPSKWMMLPARKTSGEIWDFPARHVWLPKGKTFFVDDFIIDEHSVRGFTCNFCCLTTAALSPNVTGHGRVVFFYMGCAKKTKNTCPKQAGRPPTFERG